jgi:hypothetical protein
VPLHSSTFHRVQSCSLSPIVGLRPGCTHTKHSQHCDENFTPGLANLSIISKVNHTCITDKDDWGRQTLHVISGTNAWKNGNVSARLWRWHWQGCKMVVREREILLPVGYHGVQGSLHWQPQVGTGIFQVTLFVSVGSKSFKLLSHGDSDSSSHHQAHAVFWTLHIILVTK